MRKLGTSAFVVGLAVLTSIGFSNDGMASTHGQVAGSSGQLADALVGPGGGNIGVTMESMDSARGRKLFASKGCAICHSVNGIGGERAPPLDAENMPNPINPFDFAASMWRGAEAMIAVQQEELGEQIEFTGQELADIIATPSSRRNSPRRTLPLASGSCCAACVRRKTVSRRPKSRKNDGAQVGGD